MEETTAPTLTLTFRRAGTEIAGVDETWTATAPDAVSAADHLTLYKDDFRTVTVVAEDIEGAWVGTGRAGQGTVNVGWEK